MTRFIFSKKGYAKYISHLDLARCMQRIFSRANIKIALTQGFNPHPYLVFSSALSVGISGENEMLDVKLTESLSKEEVLQKINEVSPDGIFFKDFYEDGSDFKYISRAIYTISLPIEAKKSFSDFLSLPEIIVSKKTKRGEAVFNIKDEMNFQINETETEKFVCEISLPCGNDKNYSPSLLWNTYAKYQENDFFPDIARLMFFDKDGNLFH